MQQEEAPIRIALLGRALFCEDRGEVKTPDLLRRAEAHIAKLERVEFIETQRRERFEEECECAHKWLDDQMVPRADVGGEAFSLVGRMMRLVQKAP